MQTILQSLKSKINFPLPEESYSTALIDADLDGNAIYSKALKRDVELCAADLIVVVCSSGNVSEGDYSLTLNDKKSLMSIRSIYLKRWGVADETEAKATISAGKGLW